jgi:catecholate siderophore receptor
MVVNRNQIQTKSVEGDLWDQTEVTARFKLLGFKNSLVAGVEGGQEISNPIRSSYTISKINTVPSTSLVDPNTRQPFSGTGYITSIVHTKSESVGAYFVDTVKLGDLFEISGGVRWDRFDTGYNLWQPKPPAGGVVTATLRRSAAWMSSRVIGRRLYISRRATGACTSTMGRASIPGLSR